ncbi:glycosyltransferase family 2 protein [Vibrio mangrovi]|uniref:Glycosyltransferase n=1 Tax=Vibrio mangrovi TaxID=474394 RepID=A0A1Y6IUF7_9VIBR|nr:glycosyltransferase family 2 protein [Vibrio mangrovi]MDW6001851.1 glycosyltransferase [Vibrio mangrovi]SMS00122.1 Poly-beta-1,6-N-acetyl-D-glucosamine synthase [Vibrio mangrovi]
MRNNFQDNYRPCFLIPCYNHGDTVSQVISSLSGFNYPILLVDDGSHEATKIVLEEVAGQPHIELLTLPHNQGKGGAVMAGIHHASQLGFTHAIQLDADGQHDVNALPKLITASQMHPEHLISGQPMYDDSVPKSRLYGRYVTHVWVWIETLSLAIKDSMCGFRVYPLRTTAEVIAQNSIGTRMDFDIEILVRMYWKGVEIDFIPTQVIYPEGGISHFNALKDNLRISWMHTRLFMGMLPRIPRLLARRFHHSGVQKNAHWSRRQEAGTVLGIKTLLFIYRLLGRKVFSAILKIVIYYYHQTSQQAKEASELYLHNLRDYAHQKHLPVPEKLSSYRHLLSFGYTMLDKLAAWHGDYSSEHLTIHGQQNFQQIIDARHGVLVLGSHLGNIELCRALSQHYTHLTINALVFTQHAERFNSVMKAVNPTSDLNLIQVTSVGAELAILLKQKLDQGEWVVIVGDRTSTSKEDRVIWADFLGKPAPFPQGPFILASLLNVPIYTLFGFRDERQNNLHFDVYFEHFSDALTLPRKQRKAALTQAVQQYAERLEYHAIRNPLQWYNFFNFWTLTTEQNESIHE